MKKLLLIFIFLVVADTAAGDILIFANPDMQEIKMDYPLMKFIGDTLHTAKPANNLDCDVKVREIKQERKFSTGVRSVEMLEIIFFTRGIYNTPEQKAYFPINTKVSREVKNSRFTGIVEEFQLEAEDIVNSRFIFQHDGKGEIVWMRYEDDLRNIPCRLKN